MLSDLGIPLIVLLEVKCDGNRVGKVQFRMVMGQETAVLVELDVSNG